MKRQHAVPALISLLLIILMMGGCKYAGLFVGEYEPPETAHVRAEIALVEEYADSMVRMELILTDKAAGTQATYLLSPNSLNTLASVDEFELTNGDYEAWVELEKEWDDSNGCSLYARTETMDFTFEGRDLKLTFENPWLEGTRRVIFNVDAGTMFDAGLTPDHAGVWLESTGDDGGEYHYHFHASALDGNILSGSFDIQTGSYQITAVPENSDHPDWLSSDPWDEDSTAENMEKNYFISVTDSEVEIKTTHYIEFNFDGSEESFTAETNGGTIDYADGAVHLKAAGTDAVPNLRLNDDITLTDNMLLTFELKLGSYDADLNGTDPYVHLNMLTDRESDADTRTYVTLDDGMHFHSLVEGSGSDGGTYEPDGGSLDDGAWHTFSLFIKEGRIYLYEGLSSSPLFVYDYPDGIPESGGFFFESHQEVFINYLRIEREISGALDLTEPGTSGTSGVAVTGILLEDDFILGTGQSQEIQYTLLPGDSDNQGVSWASDADSVVSVDGSGTVTAGISSGSTTITATTDDGGYQDSIVVTVENHVAVTSLTLGAVDNLLQVNGSSDTIDINIIPGNATNQGFSFTVDNTDALDVYDVQDSSFRVRGLSETSAVTVTVTSADDPLSWSSISFTVNADDTAPRVGDSFLLDEDTIYLAYSEMMNSSEAENTGAYSVVKDPSGTMEGLSLSSIETVSGPDDWKTLLYLHLADPLSAGDEIELTVDASQASDLSGNALDSSEVDGSAGNTASLTYILSHGKSVDASDIQVSSGTVSVSGGGSPVYPDETNWDPSNGMYLVAASGEALSETSIIASGIIGPTGESRDYTGAASALVEGFGGGSTAVLKNGDYEIYMMFNWDADGEMDTDEEKEDQIMSFGEPTEFTVSDGL